MSIEPTKMEVKKEDYITTGAGAAIGGAGAYGIINGRINNFAKRTVNALNSNQAECDAFIKKNEGVISRISLSGKGFFGKLNKVLKGINPESSHLRREIKNGTSTVLGEYKTKAAEALGEGASAESVKNLKDKFITKDIVKSIKNTFKFENAAKIAGAVVIGAIGFNVLKEVAQKINSNRIIKKAEKELEKEEQLKQEQPVDEIPPEEIETKAEVQPEETIEDTPSEDIKAEDITEEEDVKDASEETEPEEASETDIKADDAE